MGISWKGISKALSDAADDSEDVAKHVFKQILEHPEVAALGPAGLAFAGAKNLFSGRTLFGEEKRRSGTKATPALPTSGGYGPGKLSGLLRTALHAGKSVSGTQPYTVTSYFGAPSATAVVKNTDITDMFSSVNCTAFSTAGQFPWPYQSYRMRWSYTSVLGILTTTAATILASAGDPAWIRTLHAVFSNATEVARVALTNLGLEISLIGAQGFVATTAAAYAITIDTQPGVLWPVFYERTGSYTMTVRSDHPVGTSFHPFQISTQLDGWVINDPGLLDMDGTQIQRAIDNLVG